MARVIQHPTQQEARDKPRRLFSFLIWVPNLPRRGYTLREEMQMWPDVVVLDVQKLK